MRRFMVLLATMSFFAFEAHQTPCDVEVMSWTPRIFYIKDFLSAEECAYLIEKGRPLLEPSEIVDEDASSVGGLLDANKRSSMGMFFPRFSQEKMLRRLEERLSKLVFMPEGYGEGIQLLHYTSGGAFVPHHDFFDADTAGGMAHIEYGGQRLVTIIMYLNTPQKGGETVFPLLPLSVQPRKGAALIFYNCLPNGQEDEKTLHAGAPVVQGEKWIATKWYRSQPME